MRDLLFRANGQALQKIGNFNGLVKGSDGYLRAVFTFSPEWNGCKKAASFWSGDKEEAVLLEDDACMIPRDVCTRHVFEVSVTGVRKGYRIVSGRVKVFQEG